MTAPLIEVSVVNRFHISITIEALERAFQRSVDGTFPCSDGAGVSRTGAGGAAAR